MGGFGHLVRDRLLGALVAEAAHELPDFSRMRSPGSNTLAFTFVSVRHAASADVPEAASSPLSVASAVASASGVASSASSTSLISASVASTSVGSTASS